MEVGLSGGGNLQNQSTGVGERSEATKVAIELVQALGTYLDAPWGGMGPDARPIADVLKRLQTSSQLTRQDLPEQFRLAVAQINWTRLDAERPALRTLLVLASSFSGIPYEKRE